MEALTGPAALPPSSDHYATIQSLLYLQASAHNPVDNPIIYSSQLHGHLTLWVWISCSLLGLVCIGVFEHLCDRNCIEKIIVVTTSSN